MKKKLLISLLTVVMCFALTGCGGKENAGNDGKDNNPGGNNSQGENNQNQENNDPSTIGDYEIKSTDDRIVLSHSSGTAYLTFYFENNVIVRYETVSKYESAELAGYAYNALKNQEDKIKVEKKGLYVIETEDASEYEHFTKDELIAAFDEAGYKINE